MLPIFISLVFPRYNTDEFKRKLINQTGENGKKYNFEPDFGPFILHLSSSVDEVIRTISSLFFPTKRF